MATEWTIRAWQILFDRAGWNALLVERKEQTGEQSAPRRWLGILGDIFSQMTGTPVRVWSPEDAFRGRGCLVTWWPSREAIATAIAGGHLIYICWGMPRYHGVRRSVYRALLARADELIVNDEITRHAIETKIGRTASVVPNFVDTDFFAYKGREGRGNFLFCNGSNERDPNVLAGLAALGHKVIWLCNNGALRKAFENRFPRLMVCSDITNEHLRHFYQTCAAVVMPITRDVHAAGQTTGLEALSCGAPLLISECRAATIVKSLPTVTAIGANSPAEWSRRASEIIATSSSAYERTHAASLEVRRRWSASAVASAWSPILFRKA